MQVNQQPASDAVEVARLRELVLDLGEAVTTLTGRVGTLTGRMDALDRGFEVLAEGIGRDLREGRPQASARRGALRLLPGGAR
jgi:hypothetical protein